MKKGTWKSLSECIYCIVRRFEKRKRTDYQPSSDECNLYDYQLNCFKLSNEFFLYKKIPEFYEH
jgi:hypothetical protein